MQDKPYLVALAIILAIIVAFYGYGVFFKQVKVTSGSNYKLNETTDDDEGIEEIPDLTPSIFSKRLSYNQRRAIREVTFKNFMTRIEQKLETSYQISKEQRIMKRALRGVAGRHYRKALAAIGKKRYEEAISEFISAIKAEPNNMIIRLLTFKRMAMVYKILKYERRYCVAMIKYLDLLAKYEDDPNAREQIRNYKREIEGKLRSL